MSSITRAREFRDVFAKRIVLADGAMGTMLYSNGVFINRCFDELSLSAPTLVSAIHKQYREAGAEILETNTFGANRARLAGFGLADKLEAINHASVKLAREAAAAAPDNPPFVAAAMGPLGVRIEPLGPTSFSEARAFFREQAEALLAAGVDLFILETFSDLRELREAVLAIREAAGPDPVIVAQVTIDDFAHLPGGATPEVFTSEMNSWPAEAIGINCSVGPKTTLEAIERMAQLATKPLTAMPNAGLPTRVEGRNIYLCSPEYMAQYARRMLAAGVKLIGGCCGTTPAHIRLLRSEARSVDPSRYARRSGPPTETLEQSETETAKGGGALPNIPAAQKSQLGAKLAAGKFVSMVEILPPRGVDASREIAGAKLCAQHGIDCINVPDGPRASARLSAQVTCQLIQQHAGIEAVDHFCCRDRNLLGIQSELLGAHAAGIRNLICITGDPPRMGIYPEATAVFDVDSIGLVNIVRNLNCGLDLGGNPMGSQTALLIGVGANPGSLNLDEEIRRLEWKVAAGAEFIVTQPVFDFALFERFLRLIAHIKIPLICGIWPLTSLRNAEFMENELRVPVPPEFLERMRRADSGEKARAEGVAIAREMVARVRPIAQGVQLSAPFGRYQLAVEVAEAIGPR
ncbi:MAG TPA: bifunctional homocysteine S-methyltransferase/methylenetetrahydrofolate reductase [Bryobacteraceae bacterium]|nr:bifunctional homocysteine S-methyltransferase/methylenetetrahydrofolate reductase [Bryobacteraceae bacterium]